ncbi:hypothetical protein K505DRAFT_326099 [Melanomma pulvis-pyrius CBS 109.77]|uniref:Uncharacterized protein n=1 Tax=Melanomma pulvis-pyrius CBS 109.77 TaxID=1314802 RepID=A0A6A6X8R4_9PLEO|nr:hypothetical protein K505DRAFT_326099 [Melanomma pulvis-pyrius CBS 109.77]
MPQISTNNKYTITSPLLGPSNNLASTLDTDTVIVESSNLKASQQWYFTTTPVDGYYRFHTSQKGDDYALDIRGYDGEDPFSIHFHDVDTQGKMVGQYWMIADWGDGSARISNNFTGMEVLLDVEEADGGFTALLSNADQNKTGQKWSFAVVGVDASTSVTGTSSTATATPTSLVSSGTRSATSATSKPTTVTSTPSPTSTPASGGGDGGLSKGAIGGIAAAGIIGAVLLVAAGAYWWRRKRARAGYNLPLDHRPRMGLNA